MIPGDTKNQIIGGLSLPRLVLSGGFLLIGIFALLGIVKDWLDPEWGERIIKSVVLDKRLYRVALLASFAGFLLGWFGSFTPAASIPQFEAYIVRLKPALFWLTALSLQTIIFLYLARKGTNQMMQENQNDADFPSKQSLLVSSGIVFGLLLLFWGFVFLSGLGLKPVSYWQKTGVPILSGQVFWIWSVGILGMLLIAFGGKQTGILLSKQGVGKFGKMLDIFLFLLIWAAAALFWNLEELPHSHFAPGPYPPGYQNYPYSDAAVYDSCAEFALIGQGLCNMQYADKPLYSFILIILHSIAGNRFDVLISLQVILLALAPPILYLLGTKLHSRLAGLIMAVLAIIKGVNLIAGTLVIWDVSNPKFLMSEFPMMVILAAFTYFLVRFFLDPENGVHYLVISAGTLALATLIRHNAWFLLPFGLLMPFFLRRFPIRRRAILSVMFAAMFILTILPWMYRSYKVNHNPFYVVIPFRGLIVSQRLESSQSGEEEAQGQFLEGGSFVNDVNVKNEITLGNAVQRIGTNVSPIINHFFHNLVASLLTLPPTILLENLKDTVTQGAPFWDRNWDGSMGIGSALMMLLNSVVLAYGIGSTYSRWKWIGVVPLAVFLLYAAGNALAKTSGGRYIVPMDWIVYCYYGIGAAELIHLAVTKLAMNPAQEVLPQSEPTAISEDHSLATKYSKNKLFLIFGMFILIGALVPLTDISFPQKYPVRNDTEWIQYLSAMQIFDPATQPDAEVARFLERKDVVVLQGKNLYPRYMDPEDGLTKEIYNYLPIKNPQMVFQLINSGHPDFSEADWLVTMPLEKSPEGFVGGVDTIVLGCVAEKNIEALAVILETLQEKWIYRLPTSLLACPSD